MRIWRWFWSWIGPTNHRQQKNRKEKQKHVMIRIRSNKITVTLKPCRLIRGDFLNHMHFFPPEFSLDANIYIKQCPFFDVFFLIKKTLFLGTCEINWSVKWFSFCIWWLLVESSLKCSRPLANRQSVTITKTNKLMIWFCLK